MLNGRLKTDTDDNSFLLDYEPTLETAEEPTKQECGQTPKLRKCLLGTDTD